MGCDGFHLSIDDKKRERERGREMDIYIYIHDYICQCAYNRFLPVGPPNNPEWLTWHHC